MDDRGTCRSPHRASRVRRASGSPSGERLAAPSSGISLIDRFFYDQGGIGTVRGWEIGDRCFNRLRRRISGTVLEFPDGVG
jgi:hypothetical protein